jgi:hypothetical protein
MAFYQVLMSHFKIEVTKLVTPEWPSLMCALSPFLADSPPVCWNIFALCLVCLSVCLCVVLCKISCLVDTLCFKSVLVHGRWHIQLHRKTFHFHWQIAGLILFQQLFEKNGMSAKTVNNHFHQSFPAGDLVGLHCIQCSTLSLLFILL